MNKNNLIVISAPLWEELRNDITEIKSRLDENENLTEKDFWLSSEEVKKQLHISAKTWQTYRDERRIPFSQFGRKIYVKKSDLSAFMEEHKIQPRK